MDMEQYSALVDNTLRVSTIYCQVVICAANYLFSSVASAMRAPSYVHPVVTSGTPNLWLYLYIEGYCK